MTRSEILYHAYCLAAAFLTVELHERGVEEACDGAGHSEEDTQAIKEEVEHIVAYLTSQANHYKEKEKEHAS